MKPWTVEWRQPWYHGSDKEFDQLLPGTTITQRRDLAEAFSHQPIALWIDDDDSIGHVGLADGILYEIDESVAPEDLIPVPGSTMAPGLEWHTTRTLRVRLIARLPAPPVPAEIAAKLGHPSK